MNNMRIEGLHLKNIGIFDEVEITFPEVPKIDKAEIHIFTGPNGSGKTTILYALASAFGSPNEWNKASPNLLIKRFRTLETKMENAHKLAIHFSSSNTVSAKVQNGQLSFNKSQEIKDYSFLANMADVPSKSIFKLSLIHI